MIDIVKRFFGKTPAGPAAPADAPPRHDTRVAVCALLLEMAKIDETFTDAEMAQILSVLKKKYGVSEEDADALVSAAEKELAGSIDYWQFARLINENYSIDEKIEVIETLWRIVFVDGKMDKYENHLMHKLATLLRLTHQQLIDAKLRVLRSQ
jgi:uncharacterized tellurite resistance protein B-like protein